jgi:hypothetical protein
MATGRAVEPVTAILALRIGKALFLFTFGALTVHLAVGDVFFEE